MIDTEGQSKLLFRFVSSQQLSRESKRRNAFIHFAPSFQFEILNFLAD